MRPLRRAKIALGVSVGATLASWGAGVVPAAIADDIAFHFSDSAIAESSALLVLRDATADAAHASFVTTNDSGDAARLFVLDGRGRTTRTVAYADAARDVEALATSTRRGRVWVGDIGDNSRARSSLLLSEVDVTGATSGARSDGYALTRTLRVAYPDGAHDAETLMLAPDGRLLIVTKGFLGGTLYAVPESSAQDGRAGADGQPVMLEKLSSDNAMVAMATDGAFFDAAEGRADHFLVRGYTSATLYGWPSLERLGSMPLPAQRQGEGLGIAADDSLWLSSEGVEAAVLHLRLSDKLAALVDAPTNAATSTTAGPSAGGAPDSTGPARRPGSGTPARAEPDQDSWWGWALGGAGVLVALGLLGRAVGGPRRARR